MECERGAATGDVVPTGSAVLDGRGVYLRVDQAACSILGIGAASALGSASSARIPDGPDEVWWLEQRPELTPAPLVCRLVRGETPDRWVLRTTPAVSSTTRRATVRDYTDRVLDEAVTNPDRDSIVRLLTDEFSRICGLSGCLIVLIDEETSAPTFAGGIRLRRRELAAMEECRRRGAPMVILQAFAERRIVVKREWARHVRRDPRLAPLRPLLALDPNLHWSYVAVPLETGSRRIGVVTGMVEDPEAITPEAVSLWWELAQQTAFALRYAEATRWARAADSDRERQRLNEDLHDSVGQDVFALKMLAARTEAVALRGGDPDVADHVRELRTLADKASASLHALIGERRQVGQSMRLSQQLAGLAREVEARSGVEVRADVGEEWDHLDGECRDTVVRIVQEALRNIEKHARARTATLRVVEDASAPGTLLIEVTDDGVSFDPGAVGSAGFGLTSIRERATEHGGSVDIRATPGTTLRVRLYPTFESEWDAAVRT